MLAISANPGTAMRSQAGPGRNASPAQIGSMITRSRLIVRPRQPASVSSCRTHSRFSSGSRKPTANSSQRPTLGSPGSRGTVLSPFGVSSVLDLADLGVGRDGLADLDSQAGDRAVLVRGQRLLHLHRFQYHDRVARLHDAALGRDDLHDRALHRGDQGVAAPARAAAPAGAAGGGTGTMGPF